VPERGAPNHGEAVTETLDVPPIGIDVGPD
jgi:hypothetical protein